MTLPLRVPRVAPRHAVVLLALVVLGPLGLVGSAQQPVFRTTVDLMAVDVQVVDDKGRPIPLLGPEAFEVSINGKERRVVSAQFVRHAVAPSSAGGAIAATSVAPAGVSEADPTMARTIVVAVDSGSFTPGDIGAVTEAAQGFIRQLAPDDLVGLYIYPRISWVPPTTQRAMLGVRLANLIGEKEPLRSYYNLSPHEIVDITAQSTNPNSFLAMAPPSGPGRAARLRDARTTGLDPVLKIQARECPGDLNLDCAHKIYAEGLGLAAQLEREAHASLGGLESLLTLLSEMPGRKSVVLVTGGLLISDRLDGRPDAGTAARAMGQAAARANATIYTVQIDSTSWSSGRAAKRGRGDTNLARDRALYGNWLENFSRSAGGQRIEVPVGGGEFAFDRVLSETSAYYLLGVEPADVDRDGKPRKLSVKVDGRGVTVRSRQWVLVPPRTRRAAVIPAADHLALLRPRAATR